MHVVVPECRSCLSNSICDSLEVVMSGNDWPMLYDCMFLKDMFLCCY